MKENKQIEVEIFNQKFLLTSEKENAERLQEVALFVDQKMRDIYKSTNLSSALKIAILTALNLADELFRVEVSKQKNDFNQDLMKRVLSIVDRVKDMIRLGRDSIE